MKNLFYIIITILLLTSCNNDDGLAQPVSEPVVANAKVLFPGDCRLNEMFVELYNSDPNVIPPLGINNTDYRFFNLPEEIKVDNLEVYIEYEELPDAEIPFCPSNGKETYVVKISSIA
jgi:hypothetical protein